MPADAVADCRRARARLDGRPRAVVHGDPGPANIRISPAGAGLLDWDEPRVDYTDLDLAELPGSELPLPRLTLAREAATAWEAANGWIIEPAYARHQLAAAIWPARTRLTTLLADRPAPTEGRSARVNRGP
jgi:aminoglycoside phosphotransferase (APT) family kinase protein